MANGALLSLFALIQFPTAWQAITIFVVIQVVATVVGNLIYPRLQAETQNIDPVATLLSLAFWSWLWGLPGAFEVIVNVPVRTPTAAGTNTTLIVQLAPAASVPGPARCA